MEGSDDEYAVRLATISGDLPDTMLGRSVWVPPVRGQPSCQKSLEDRVSGSVFVSPNYTINAASVLTGGPVRLSGVT